MCGIVGFVRNGMDESKGLGVIKKMADSIAHRGPDAENFYHDEQVFLGFRRLAFIDVRGATSPLPNEDKTKIVVFNGEIYNFQPLRQELIDKGHKFITHGDAEVLLHGYEEWGVELLQKLRGMYAFTIYDQTSGKIFMARDHFGIKPLYYYKNDGEFFFASELKAFLHHPKFEKVFDESLLPAYLSFSCVPGGENTFFKNVKKLLPGHYATYDLINHTLEIKKYFNVDFAIDKTKSFEGYVAEISQTFKDSVSAHMISDPDIKVGAFLSGGVDSAYTVAEVKKHVSPQTYTIDFEEKKFSEAEDATHTANLLKVQNTRVVVSAEKYLAEASKVQYHMDEPLANPSGNLLYFLSQRTAQDLKAVLSGEGADEMFGGYNVYKEPLALAKYQQLPLPLRKTLANAFEFANGFIKIPGTNFVRRGALSIEERYVGNSNVFSLKDQEKFLRPKFYNKDYSPQDYTTPIYNQLKKEMGDKYADLDDVSKMQYLDIHLWMVHEILQKADKMSMAHSLELRVPFLDIEIWKVGKQLPLDYKVSLENTKLAERAAALSELDKYSTSITKRAFPSPLPEWLKTELYQNKLREYFTSEVARKYFNTDELLKILEEQKNGSNHSRKLWTVFTFLIWYEQFFGN
jgi:asparagine synthase (glutamine-hydrolysing)